MRLTPDERRERLRERTVQCLVVNGGWLSRTMIKAGAFGGDRVTAAELDEALAGLLADGVIMSRDVAKVVGRFGRGCTLYSYAAVATALPAEQCERCHMEDLDHAARLAALDLAMGLVTLLAETA